MQRHRRPSSWPAPSPTNCGSISASVAATPRTSAPTTRELTAALEEFVLRGGKRLRPAFAYWGWRAVADAGAIRSTRRAAAVLGAGAAARVRAGARRRHRRLGHPPRAADRAPAVRRQAPRPAAGTGRRDQFGISAAILLGDLALVWADDIVATADLPARGAPSGAAGLGRHPHRGARRPVPRHRRRGQRRRVGGVGDDGEHLQDRVVHDFAPVAARRRRRRRPSRCAGHLPRARHQPRRRVPAARRRARRVRRPGRHRQAVGRRPALR